MNMVKKGIVKKSITINGLFQQMKIVVIPDKYWLINGADFLINGESVSNSLDGE